MNRVFSCVLIFSFLLVFVLGAFVPSDADARSRKSPPKHAQKKPERPHVISAKAALLMDMKSGRKIYAKDITRKILPASTTKVLTAILVLEKLDLDDYVTISPRAADVLPSKIYAQVGDKYRVRDLLYAALLNSANDAAIALAEAVAGSEEQFVAMMNQRAKQIGAHATLFANAHGLPADDPQYSTAYDMALILQEALKKPFFREAMQSRYKKIISQNGKVTLLRSHNKCLFKEWKKSIYGKTGYTNAARACFLGYFLKGDDILIIAVFGCSERWDDIKAIVERFAGVDL
jgi:D-alanyl-D-alanine carboxypeptidase (penicillin-binding protein 5/6)